MGFAVHVPFNALLTSIHMTVTSYRLVAGGCPAAEDRV